MVNIIIESVVNPRYARTDGSVIDCVVKFGHLADPVPFGATPFDPEPYGVQIYNDCIAGKYGPIAPYDPPIIPVVEVNA